MYYRLLSVNIVLDRLEDSGVAVTGTMKKSNGSLDFSTSDDNGVIIFTSSDYIETRVELTDVSTYNVVLLPGEYRVESIYSSNESSNHVDETSVGYQLQQTVNISSDQIYDVIFPVTTLNGKVTDASGNTLENMSVLSM